MLSAACNAQKLFTLEDLNFGGTNYRHMTPENRFTTWWGDRLMRLDADEVAEINIGTGKEKTLFTLDELNTWAETTDSTRVHSLYYAEFPYAGKTQVVVRNREALLVVDWKQKKVVRRQQVTIDNQAEQWSAASGAVAYVKGDNLYVVDSQGHTSQLTTDGSPDIVYGQSVHRDEFGIRGGLFWSPDGQRLAFYRMDQSMVKSYPLTNIFARETELEAIKYPMAGETSHKVTVGIYDLRTRQTIYLKTADPTDRYFTNIAWGSDAQTIYMKELNRDQTFMELISYDATTGARLEVVATEQDDKYVEPLTPIAFVPGSDRYITQSQKDGYNHLYLYEGSTLVRQLTSGQWVVTQFLGFSRKDNSAVFVGTKDGNLQRNIYKVNIKTGMTTRLDNGRGVHNASLSASGLYVVDNYSEPDVPRKIDIINVSTGKRINYLTAADPWSGYTQPIIECGTIKAADGATDLYYRMVKPHDFDPNKKYPTVIYVYGGPHAHNVQASWHYYTRGWEPYMAQKGYIVFVLDNRGSEARGKDFEQVTFRHLGVEETKDQMCGVDYLKSLPYVDADRLGVHGWSFGGFMTITMMTRHPDVFKVGVAGGPVIDWKWYEVMYGERYMDTPQANPEGYAESSLLTKAKNLKGKLQIIIGQDDPVVVPQHALGFLSECINAGTQPDFFTYPGEPHNMRGHQSVHLHERITQYFEDYLK